MSRWGDYPEAPKSAPPGISDPPARRTMKRSDLELLKAQLSHTYAEQLDKTRTDLTLDQRARMCVGFENGVAWFLRTLEAAGFKVDE